MSSPLAIAATTAAIKDLLNDGLLNHDLSAIGSFSVTSLPPDRVTTGQTEPNQLNVFLYQVTPNLGWRNVGLPSRDAGGARLTNPPLALDLHYMITAYGAEPLNAEVLLGYAMHLLHETPVLGRSQLRTVLGGTSPVPGGILPPSFGAMSAADLADQVELLKITPVALSGEDLSKLWTAMQARYRPTAAYLVTVVLIQATTSTPSPLPVLKRGPDDRGAVALAAPFASLSGARAAASELLPAVRLGDDLVLSGRALDAQGNVVVVFENAQSGAVVELPPAAGATATSMTVHVPSIGEDADAMHEWAAGLLGVSLRITRPGIPVYSTNSVPIALAPRITVAPPGPAAGDFTLTVTATPRLRPEQEGQAQLVFGSQTVLPASITTPSDEQQPTTLTFDLKGVAAGEYVARLRVAGIDSLPITVTGTPPKLDFDPTQKVVVA